MNPSKWLLAFALVPALSLSSAARGESGMSSQVETGRLTSEEKAMLERIRKFHPDFHFSARVRRFIEITDGNRRAVYSEVQFDAVDGLILGEFISYRVGFPDSLESVQFSHDAGTAFRGYGSFHLTEDAVTRVETSCGTAGCTQEIWVNGKSVYPQP